MTDQAPKVLYIQVAGVKTRYWEAGNSGSPVLLLHGLGGLIEHWGPNIPALSKHHRVYALDMVGFGYSEKPVAPYSISYLAKFVQEFMVQKSIEEACVIGHSLGSGVAFELSLFDPSRIKKLVLTSGFGFGRNGALVFKMLSLPYIGEKLMQGDRGRDGTADFLKPMFYDPAFMTDELIDVTFDSFCRPNSTEVYLATLRSVNNFFGIKRKVVQNTFIQSKNIAVPVLVLWGREDRILPVEHAYTAKNKLESADLHIFENCGHLPQIECTKEYNEIVLKFLENR